MVEINDKTGLKLSVYHSFNDEVDSLREHVWLCNGPCRTKAPLYGIIKRARNLPPNSHTDWWFDLHEKNCCGIFLKVIEPKNYMNMTLRPRR